MPEKAVLRFDAWKDIVNENTGWSVLAFFHRAVTSFVALATLIALFVGWEFIQARSHVTVKEQPLVLHMIDSDSIMTAYRNEGETPPPIMMEVVGYYNLGAAWAEAPFKMVAPFTFYECPQSPQEWDLLKASVQARWELVSIVASRFKSGKPRAACIISLRLAIDGDLNEEQLLVAAEALERSEYISVGLSVQNTGNAVATGVKVLGPDGFQCEFPGPDEGPQCGPFDLEIQQEQGVVFTADESVLYSDKSDVELAAMFKPDWERWEGPDRPRIQFLLVVAGLMTTSIVILELLRNFLVQLWGKILFGIVLAGLLICMFMFIRKLLPLAV